MAVQNIEKSITATNKSDTKLRMSNVRKVELFGYCCSVLCHWNVNALKMSARCMLVFYVGVGDLLLPPGPSLTHCIPYLPIALSVHSSAIIIDDGKFAVKF